MSKKRKKYKMDKQNQIQPIQKIQTLTSKKPLPPCHPVTEIIPGLYLSSYKQVKELIVDKEVDVLVPLDSLDGNIWDLGFRGEILYYPILDFSVLPDEIYSRLIDEIIQKLRLENKKVGLFCLGGHGRTGYVAAGILGQEGYADPIKYLREHYCSKAVETNAQIKAISEYLGIPSLYETYKEKYNYSDILYGFDYDTSIYDQYYGFRNSHLESKYSDPFYAEDNPNWADIYGYDK